MHYIMLSWAIEPIILSVVVLSIVMDKLQLTGQTHFSLSSKLGNCDIHLEQ
jgi:hypothetical protein